MFEVSFFPTPDAWNPNLTFYQSQNCNELFSELIFFRTYYCPEAWNPKSNLFTVVELTFELIFELVVEARIVSGRL